MLERFRAWYADAGLRVECVMAVQARGVTAPLDFDRRVRAVSTFSALSEAAALAAANKRVANILQKLPDGSTPGAVDPALFRDAAESALFAELSAAMLDCAPMLSRADYTAALSRLAALRDPVDAFFSEVLVMSEDAAERGNRIALLAQLRGAFLAVADVTALAVS